MIDTLKHAAGALSKTHLVVMSVIFIGAAVAGALLLPGDAERVAMLERDGDNMRAMTLLERRYEAGDRSQRTLYQLEQLYQHFGQLDKARLMLEKLAESRPRDTVLQRRLVKFYRDTQDGEAYLSGLSRLVAQRYSEPVCRELIAQLRLVGQYAREREAIERCRRRGYRRGSDIVRLAELEAASGNKPRALALLRSVDDIKGLANPRERLMLATLLLDGQETDEVTRRAIRWLARARDAHFAQTLMAYLGQRKAYDTAIKIAAAASRPGDALSLSVAELMLERDQTAAARSYLRGWLEASDIKQSALVSRFIAAALDAEAPELAMLSARRFGMERLPEKDLVQIAEALGATGRRDEFELVRTALSADTIVAHPLLSAMVELNKGAKATTRDILDNVSSDALDTWRLALWARLMRETGKGAHADAKLRERGAPRLLATMTPAVEAAKARAGRSAVAARRSLAKRARSVSLRRLRTHKVRAARAKVLERRQARTRHLRAEKRRRTLSKRVVRAKKKERAPAHSRYVSRPSPIVRPVAQKK